MIMEWKTITSLFWKQRRLLWMTVGSIVLIGVVWQQSQRALVQSDLMLNVTRGGTDESPDYQYHDFYRLQADERFADTVVRWLGAPRIVNDIVDQSVQTKTQSSVFSKSVLAERLSSQMIRVTYKASDEAEAYALAQSIVTRLNEETNLLNKDQQEKTWFVIVGEQPVVTDGRISLISVLFLALVLGLFIGFWVVLVRHYYTKSINV